VLDDVCGYVEGLGPMTALRWGSHVDVRHCMNGHGAPGVLGAPRDVWLRVLEANVLDAKRDSARKWPACAAALSTASGHPFWNMHNVLRCDFYHVSCEEPDEWERAELVLKLECTVESKSDNEDFNTNEAITEALERVRSRQ
jgi:hypothetical protein